MEESDWQNNLLLLKNSLTDLEESLNSRIQRYVPFKNIYVELIKMYDKFAECLITLSESVDQQIAVQVFQSQQHLLQSYSSLKMALITMADHTRQIALRSRNEVLEPLKVFGQNYRKVSMSILEKIKACVANSENNEAEMIKNREAYYGSCQKLEKHKDTQAKIIIKIENGHQGELQMFNKMTKSLLERVSSCQKKYQDSIQKANDFSKKSKLILQKQLVSLTYNESSRVEFLKKVAVSEVKFLQVAPNFNFKNKQLNKSISTNSSLNKSVRSKLSLSDTLEKVSRYSNNHIQQQYISHEQLIKNKKRKQFQQENPLLMKLFNKIKEGDKKIMIEFLHQILENQINKKDYSNKKVIELQEKEKCKDKIFNLQHYSFYFIEFLFRQISEMNSYYCKLSQSNFNLLLQIIDTIFQKLDLVSESMTCDLNLTVGFKIIHVSQRLILRDSHKHSYIVVMSEKFGKKNKKLKDPQVLARLLTFLIKKAQKRKAETKGMMSFTKGFFSNMVIGKKDDNFTQQDEFNGLQQFTNVMANLSIPSQIALPFIKNTLSKANYISYLYLKDIIMSKKDRQERQRLFYKPEVKEKKQIQMKNVIQNKRSAVFCIKLAASKGFFCENELMLRLCCKELSSIHLQILYHLQKQLSKKWLCLVNYSQLKLFTSIQQSKNAHVQDEQIIAMDVNRSLHIHQDTLKQATLKNLLLCYAGSHPNMPYCQGMNYLAGYLLLKIVDEAKSYAILCFIMQNRFFQIFDKQFEKMQLKLYLFDRLLSIFHPDISDHFKKEMISSECYALSWFITAFSSTYQYTLSSYLVDAFWERFIMWGWPQFYKFSLWLFLHFKQQLLSSSYDECLHILGQMPKCKLFISNQQEFAKVYPHLQVFESIDDFCVTQDLIFKLQKQFVHDF